MHPTLTRLLAAGTAATLGVAALATVAPRATAAGEASGTKAANYLVKHLPATSDGAAASMTAALGLATTNACTYAPSLRTLVKQIEKNAKAYLYPGRKLNQARAANMAITVKALGLNPKKFAGYNLVSLVTKNLPKDGQVGPSKSAFSQSLGIVALKRADATIPVTLLTNLLGQQGRNGAFGYEWPKGTFNADPDTTALGILALKAIGQLAPQQDGAVGWAEENQEDAGYWENYSPVDSTALVGSALKAVGKDVTKAKAWLGGVQHADGGFPNSLDAGTASDATATANALYLINGKSLLDVSLNLAKCPKSPAPLPTSTASCTGVWVVVDRGNGQATTRCATKYGTGLDALKSAGVKAKTFSTQFGPAVCQVAGFPAKCDTTWSLGFWSYWQTTPKSDGTWNAWDFAPVGAAGSKPVKGAAEGWSWIPAKTDTAAPELPPAGYAAAPVPTIAGTPKVGQTLTVTTGAWKPKPDQLAVQWYRSGKAIKKATKTSYKLTKSDAKKTITVKVTAGGKGLQTVSRTSAATPKVAK